MSEASAIKVKIQLMCGEEIAMGPGKADLLDAIHAHGSISAAGRALGMSYRRTWLLVDAMNRCWQQKLVDTVPGGSREKGAHVTETGERILTAYRAMQEAATGAVLPSADELLSLLRDEPMPHEGHAAAS